MQEETRFRVGQLVSVELPRLLTSAAEKLAVEAYSILLLSALGPYQITSTTSHNITTDQDGVPKMITADQALLEPGHMSLQDDIVDDKCSLWLLETSVKTWRKSRTGQGEVDKKVVKRRDTLLFIS